jgi:hypothetical protein
MVSIVRTVKGKSVRKALMAGFDPGQLGSMDAVLDRP